MRLLLVILFFQHFNGVTTIRLTIGAVDIGFEAWIVGADFAQHLQELQHRTALFGDHLTRHHQRHSRRIRQDHVGVDAADHLFEIHFFRLTVQLFLERGIVVEKTGPYNLLFLFSIGIDKTKALSLLRALTDFKRAFDLNLRVKNMLPSLYREDPEFYENMRIQDLAQNIHKLIEHHNLPDLMFRAFEVLPSMVMTPYAAFQKELHGQTEEVYLEEMVGRVNANMILPYPPGVPLVMPGEMITEESRPVLEFLQMLCEIGAHYPGFETDIHGAYRQADGRYTVKVLKEENNK